MARPSPLWRRFMPRFGLLGVFAGMLLLISAAGWWKFHRDLYIEEVEVIRALKGMGKVTVRRSNVARLPGAEEESFDGPIPWNAPLLPPVQRIYVEGELTADLHDAAASLPRLQTFSFEEGGFVSRPDPFYDLDSHLGRPLPALPEATLTAESFDSPLPEGEEVDAAEAERVAQAIHEAWHDEAAMPDRLLAVSRKKPLGGRTDYVTEVHLVESGRRFHFYDRSGSFRTVFLAKGVRYDLWRRGSRWHLETRAYDAGVERDDEVFRRFPTDAYPYLGPDFFGFLTVSRAIEAMPRFEFDRIAKLDDVRYRVDFKPFAAPNNERDAQSNVIDPRVTEWSLVLRSDLNWAPEESKHVQSIHQTSWPAPTPFERRLSQRFRREGEHVLLTERIVQDSRGAAGGMTVDELSQYVYAYDVDPEYHERIFDPVSLDPEPWAPRRELPWLRWYRVTFVLACGLMIALPVRSFLSNRASTEAESDEMEKIS